MAPGARIADALQAAGGAVDGADTIALNMARQLVDGEQIVVGLAPVPGQPITLRSSIGAGTRRRDRPLPALLIRAPSRAPSRPRCSI
ncbi:hypothetical protein NIIDMKKI_21540 [Mycobacterium kansasii]|uniref:Uncharacterized protein n=1 Tax=Mycobacterium kansasii TaxID=1768 RepID=A0A7G1IEL6_MYCKA|nr:hypothetical protein NIIDMKKI_21540 [Mycobacterium kansasii]